MEGGSGQPRPREPESPFLPRDISHDWVGPPDSVSKIRPFRRVVPPHETWLERTLRQRQADVLEWNHNYWRKHNRAFKRERRQFVEDRLSAAADLSTDRRVGDDEMALFYRDFMERNREKHRRYNWQWYRHNAQLLGLAGLVAAVRVARRIRLIR